MTLETWITCTNISELWGYWLNKMTNGVTGNGNYPDILEQVVFAPSLWNGALLVMMIRHHLYVDNLREKLQLSQEISSGQQQTTERYIWCSTPFSGLPVVLKTGGMNQCHWLDRIAGACREKRYEAPRSSNDSSMSYLRTTGCHSGTMGSLRIIFPN